MANRKTVLLGNGILRIKESSALTISWREALEELSKMYSVPLNDLSQKPLPLAFEKIRLQLIRDNKNPNVLLKDVARLTRMAGYGTYLIDIYSGLTKHTLTTNYGFFIETGMGFRVPVHDRFNNRVDEKYYSLFRNETDRKNKTLWRIHGEAEKPQSLLLGYSQYAKYMGQIKDYLYKGIQYAGFVNLVRSPLMGNSPDFNFEKNAEIYSWIDIFLKDELHIIGLGLDFSEIILWWLLSEKMNLHAKYPKKVGSINYYSIELPNIIKPVAQQCIRAMLRDLGANVIEIKAESYDEGYRKIADSLKPYLYARYQNNDYLYVRKLVN
jgi:hypothetical protein